MEKKAQSFSFKTDKLGKVKGKIINKELFKKKLKLKPYKKKVK